jgi:murein DD-endopeptidase MepM/ murein hydrolase activator NlpD
VRRSRRLRLGHFRSSRLLHPLSIACSLALLTAAPLGAQVAAAEDAAPADSVVVSSPFASKPGTGPRRIELPGIIAEIGPAVETAAPVTTAQILSSPFAAPVGSAPAIAPKPPAARAETKVASLVVPSTQPKASPAPKAKRRSSASAKPKSDKSAAVPKAAPARKQADFVRRSARIAGVVSTTLYDAVRALGESPQLASDIAELFAWDVDFSRRAQPGDQFAVLYERLYKKGADGAAGPYVGPGRILAARYEGQAGRHSAVYFETSEARGGYYRPDGSSIERQFLLAPLKYTRVSSRFSAKRYHPILKVNRPHHGIDYAADAGTPIVAVAAGRVIFRGRAGSYGNLVKVRHPNGYVSYYAHMSRFGDGLAVGDAVHQKQVLGYVGSTGLSTGPHVCFRVAKDGRFVDPASLRTPGGTPVSPARLGEFVMARDALFEQLDGGARIVTEEAF